MPRPPEERAADNPWPEWPKVYKMDYGQEEAKEVFGADPRRYLTATKKFIGDETFLLTYGDGVSNVNLNDLIKFHKKNGKMVTVTAVRPSARFGELQIQDEKVFNFTVFGFFINK